MLENWMQVDEETTDEDATYYHEINQDGTWTGRQKIVFRNMKWEDGTTMVVICEPPKWPGSLV